MLVLALRSVEEGCQTMRGQELSGAAQQQRMGMRLLISFILQSPDLVESLTLLLLNNEMRLFKGADRIWRIEDGDVQPWQPDLTAAGHGA